MMNAYETSYDYGYAPIYNLLMGYSLGHDYVKCPANDFVKMFLSGIYYRTRYDVAIRTANYYRVSMNYYTEKYGRAANHNPSGFSMVYIVEFTVDDDKTIEKFMRESGSLFINGQRIYIIYMTNKYKIEMSNNEFMDMISYLFGCIKKFIDISRIYDNMYHDYPVCSLYEKYMDIFTMYCIFKWIYDIKSNIDYESIWKKVLYTYAYIFTFVVFDYSKPILKIYYFLCDMAKNNHINMNDVIRDIVEFECRMEDENERARVDQSNTNSEV